MIVPLHNHSDYSNLDGNSLPVEIAARTEQIGAPACAITDHGVITGHLDFAKAMEKRKLKPIYGLEGYHGDKWAGWKGNERDQPHSILLAQTDTGLQNLYRIVHNAANPDRFRFVPRFSWDDLEKYNEGIIATSACALGKVTQEMLNDDYTSLNRYLDIFGDRFYIELHTYECTKMFEDAGMTQADINRGLAAIGQERGVPFVYANDAHYAFPEQYEFHDAYVVAATGKTKKSEANQSIYTPVEERKMWHPQCLYIMDEEDVRERLNYLPDSIVDEAIDNSVAIADSIDAKHPEVKRHLPVFIPEDCPFPEAEGFDDAGELFAHLVLEGIKERYGEDAPQEVWDRALRETEVFLKDGLHHYFLMAWDLNLFCDAEELPTTVKRWVPERTEPILRGPGRGSSAGCIVAYALRITDVDPLRYGLIFERFWNDGRAKGFPDIDSDFARKWRAAIVKYLKKRHGEDRVFAIGTTARMKPKAAIDRLRGAYDMTYDEADELKKIVDTVPNINILGPDSIAWSRESDPDYVHDGKERTIYVVDYVDEEIQKWVGKDEKRAKYARGCAHLVNRVENYGIHPSGILICDESLFGLVPTDARGTKEERKQVTQFTMDQVDSLLMIKLDILGLKTLDTLDAWQKFIAKKGIELDFSRLDEEEYSEEMWELLDKKYTAGIFQVEQGIARQFLEKFGCRSVEDLAISGSIIRPGPNESMDSFLIRRNGGEDEEFDGRKVPLLEENLTPTYGWFLYQEQVIRFFSDLGYNLSDADAVRKILGKKKPEELKALHAGTGDWKGKGYKDIAYPQLGEELAEQIWIVLEHFARYSFNKSHSVAYAVIGFRCLLAKYFAPAEFYAACIATTDDRAKFIPTYVDEARRMGIQVYAPDILNSDPHVTVRDGSIYLGFSEVKGVKTGGEVIVQLRDEGYDISSPEKLWEVLEEQAKAISKMKAAAKKKGELYDGPEKSWKQQLNSAKIQALLDVGAWDALGENERSLADKQKAEKELLGVILTDDSQQILSNHFEEIDGICDVYEEALNGVETGDRFTLPGTVVNIRQVKAKSSGQSMGIITIEYEGDTLEFATSPRSWRSHKFLWKERACGIFEVKKSDRGYNFESGSKLS
jgi:DNA polymerase-3 subunit alpha